MDLRAITSDQQDEYNSLATHIMQSWEWGEFRQKMGIPLHRYGIYEAGKLTTVFQLTVHKIPLLNLNVGYLPKGPFPDAKLATALKQVGSKLKCAFIKLEPNSRANPPLYTISPSFVPSIKPLFTKYNFVLDLTKTEDELLQNMHPKTRYNLRLAQKKGVIVETRVDDQAFEIYLKLYFETTARQQYFGHNKTYHKKVWEILKEKNMARILIGSYQKEPLTAWMLFNFKDTLYYPYGGSSTKYRELMSSNLVAWEAIKLGKKMNLKSFDMWGALGPDADPQDPWFGFHRFKQGYGGELVKYLGTYDLIFNNTIYWAFSYVDKFTKLKVLLLKAFGK